MPVKVLMIPITGPGDVLKIQDILAEVLKDGAKSVECACGSECGKYAQVTQLPDGMNVLAICRGPQVLGGIHLDADGRKRLVEELGGKMEA